MTKKRKSKSGAGTKVPEDSRDHHDLQNSGQGDKEAAEYRRTEVNKFYFLFMHFPNSISLSFCRAKIRSALDTLALFTKELEPRFWRPENPAWTPHLHHLYNFLYGTVPANGIGLVHPEGINMIITQDQELFKFPQTESTVSNISSYFIYCDSLTYFISFFI